MSRAALRGGVDGGMTLKAGVHWSAESSTEGPGLRSNGAYGIGGEDISGPCPRPTPSPVRFLCSSGHPLRRSGGWVTSRSSQTTSDSNNRICACCCQPNFQGAAAATAEAPPRRRSTRDFIAALLPPDPSVVTGGGARVGPREPLERALKSTPTFYFNPERRAAYFLIEITPSYSCYYRPAAKKLLGATEVTSMFTPSRDRIVPAARGR
jgi:hypothetical protein